MTLKTRPRVTWLADTKAGLGHAFLKPGVTRALCGARTISPQFGFWPLITRCPRCAAELGELI